MQTMQYFLCHIRNDRSMHGFMIIEIIKNKKEQNNK